MSDGSKRIDPADVELLKLRLEIDAVDRAIVEAVGMRVLLGTRIGEIKKERGLPVLDPAREAAVVRRAAERARDAGLDEEAVREIFWRLIGLSRRTQRDEPGGTL